MSAEFQVNLRPPKAESSYLSTVFAHVRLLSSVNTLMHSQGRPLDELLSTARVVANVWSNSCMYSLCLMLGHGFIGKVTIKKLTMACEIATSCETLSTSATRVGFGRRLGSSLRRLCKLSHGMRHIGSHCWKSHATGSHVGLGHMERGVHDCGRAIRATVLQATIHGRLRVPRVFGTVRGVGTVKRNGGELLGNRLLGGESLRLLLDSRLACHNGSFLVQHAGDAHNFTWSWR